MTKIKYYESIRNPKTGELDHFEQFEGYLEKFYDVETDMQINVVFRKDDELLWKATHLESGVLIVSGFTSRKECVDKMIILTNKVAKLFKEQNKFWVAIQRRLDDYRNERS